MTYEDAIKFFEKHGNVGSEKSLKDTRPTQQQLNAAAAVAMHNGCQAEETDDAVTAIKRYWEALGTPIPWKYETRGRF